jgi:hypothetical protein
LREACGSASAANLAELPLGARDDLLLDLRAALFGRQLDCLTECAACGERTEWSCDVDALRVNETARPAADVQEWSSERHRVRFRLLNGLDLAALHAADDSVAARALLLERCVLDASRDAEPITARELPDSVVEALSIAIAELDPQAALSIEVACAACGDIWESSFDVAAFFWVELDHWAKRLFSDVHILATHYGWSESDILSITPLRRARYLEMVTG